MYSGSSVGITNAPIQPPRTIDPFFTLSMAATKWLIHEYLEKKSIEFKKKYMVD
jgi:hypothetical protein